MSENLTTVLDTEYYSIVSAHAEIRFTIDGVLANGNTRSAKLKFYMDSVKRVLTEGYSLLTELEK